jgi:hypothetical protein
MPSLKALQNLLKKRSEYAMKYCLQTVTSNKPVKACQNLCIFLCLPIIYYHFHNNANTMFCQD